MCQLKNFFPTKELCFIWSSITILIFGILIEVLIQKQSRSSNRDDSDFTSKIFLMSIWIRNSKFVGRSELKSRFHRSSHNYPATFKSSKNHTENALCFLLQGHKRKAYKLQDKFTEHSVDPCKESCFSGNSQNLKIVVAYFNIQTHFSQYFFGLVFSIKFPTDSITFILIV